MMTTIARPPARDGLRQCGRSVLDPFALPAEIVDRETFSRCARHLAERGVRLPRLSDLARADWRPAESFGSLAEVDPDSPHPANLARVHWYNDATRRGRTAVPAHLELPESLTGSPARIVVVLGERFPMIGAHKVLPAYACLVPRLVSGLFDPSRHRAVWPSTGNYCRGGIAISRILGCRGVAVLPEGMSAERFEWLQRWVENEGDIVRTPGTESNVREIYEACDRLAEDEANDIVNQFSEFGNYLIHRLCTARAVTEVFEHLTGPRSEARLAAFVSASGSAGTLAAGDALKESHGTRVVAVEPVQCPTLLYNGYGEHAIQGIGDKHVPLIHNVTNTDLVVGVSDEGSDSLDLVFNSEAGRSYLASRRGVPEEVLGQLGSLGLSGIANVMAAVKTAYRLDLGPDDVVVTVATDGAGLYASERKRVLAERFDGAFDEVAAAETFGRHMLGLESDHVLELDHRERDRVFNLGYYTWVEQRGIALEDFDRRRDQRFWRDLWGYLEVWDGLIERMNAEIEAARP